MGRRIVEDEQRGEARADYGEQLVKRLACADAGQMHMCLNYTREQAFEAKACVSQSRCMSPKVNAMSCVRKKQHGRG